MFLLFTLPGLPPPSGLDRAKSTCFWLSTRTRKEGTSTICLPTLHKNGWKH
ncbi:hypothetical protein Mapa_007925 [Marchantia paleacea]|nr:hypothetical protein Mapa_007925 [Marchantia paleacea]